MTDFRASFWPTWANANAQIFSTSRDVCKSERHSCAVQPTGGQSAPQSTTLASCLRSLGLGRRSHAEGNERRTWLATSFGDHGHLRLLEVRRIGARRVHALRRCSPKDWTDQADGPGGSVALSETLTRHDDRRLSGCERTRRVRMPGVQAPHVGGGWWLPEADSCQPGMWFSLLDGSRP